MTIRSGLFVRKDATQGTTPLEARIAQAGMFSSSGVLSGMLVTGRASWAYNVAAGSVVAQRSAADGVVLFANDSTAIVGTTGEGSTVPPAPATGSRIDIIYALHRDVDNGDADSQPLIAVASGTASGSPVAPTIPSGAVELARATVAAGATNTAHANVTRSYSNRPVAQIRDNRPVGPLVQGGTRSFTWTNPQTAVTTVTETFPQAYSSTPAVSVNIASGSGVTGGWIARAINVSNTGFTWYLVGPSSTWSTAIPCQYTAVGPA